MPDHADLTRAFPRMLARFEHATRTLDFALLSDIFDRADPSPFYLPAERLAPLRDWPDIDQYWDNLRENLSAIIMWPTNAIAQGLAPGVGVGYFAMTGALIPRVGPPQDLYARVAMTLRHRADGWKIAHYVEASLSAAAHIRRLAERATDTNILAELPPRSPA